MFGGGVVAPDVVVGEGEFGEVEGEGGGGAIGEARAFAVRCVIGGGGCGVEGSPGAEVQQAGVDGVVA